MGWDCSLADFSGNPCCFFIVIRSVALATLIPPVRAELTTECCERVRHDVLLSRGHRISQQHDSPTDGLKECVARTVAAPTEARRRFTRQENGIQTSRKLQRRTRSAFDKSPFVPLPVPIGRPFAKHTLRVTSAPVQAWTDSRGNSLSTHIGGQPCTTFHRKRATPTKTRRSLKFAFLFVEKGSRLASFKKKVDCAKRDTYNAKKKITASGVRRFEEERDPPEIPASHIVGGVHILYTSVE